MSPDFIYEPVFFDTILSPLGFEERLLLSFVLQAGDGYKIGAFSAAFLNFIRDALISETEMAGRFSKG